MIEEICVPNYLDGRVFVSPIIGCSGGCKYCYLRIHSLKQPLINPIGKDRLIASVTENKNVVLGKGGTIISVGAWGDIFQNKAFSDYSLSIIEELVSLGNPIQFMSKYQIDEKNIERIAKIQLYPNQILYSTTITTIDLWKQIEPNTTSPEKRLNTCLLFKRRGIESNVMIKPFISGITDKELDSIIDLLLLHKIAYCVLGVFYYTDEIHENMNSILAEGIKSEQSFLDCNGSFEIASTRSSELLKYVSMFQKSGIKAFLKSSCVNANISRTNNPSNYNFLHNGYCIGCGNCKVTVK